MEPLRPLSNFSGRPGPVVLCILDGVAYGKNPEADAFQYANTPNFDWIEQNCPGLKLRAHGPAVGMPSEGDMGNSEVGHNALGCGRVFDQGAKLVENSINSGDMFEGQVWQEQIQNVIDNDKTLHFIGLLSDGNVHSHVRHLHAMINKAAESGVKKLRVHGLLDGRDVGERSAMDYIGPLEELLASHNANGCDFKIASGGGRMYMTMDRYEAEPYMVERGWNTHVLGKGRQFASADEAIKTYYEELECIDQDLQEFVIVENGEPVGKMVDNDSVILFNFRGDRGMEISLAFDQEEGFELFERTEKPKVLYAGMMEYDGDLHIPNRYLVDPPQIDRTIGEYVANAEIKQLAISETQKYGHVTYFFNGNRSAKFNDSLEDYIEIPSDPVPFWQRPWMKAAQITDHTVAGIQSGEYGFIRLNVPNGDMVGHTGNFQATAISCEAADLGLKRIMDAIKKANGILVVTADHGNADEMYELDKQGNIKCDENGIKKNKTSHSLNPVPCFIYDPNFKGEYEITKTEGLGISSVTATCINLMGYQTPEGYDEPVIKFK